jgi:hypothetical protein
MANVTYAPMKIDDGTTVIASPSGQGTATALLLTDSSLATGIEIKPNLLGGQYNNIISAGDPFIKAIGDGEPLAIGTHNGSAIRTDASTIKFYTSNAHSMTLTNTGLGIGTTNPSAKLHTQVSSETTIGIFENTAGKSFNILTDANRVYLSEGTSSTTNSFIINGTDSQLEFRTNGSEKMRIDSAGNVGIGVSPQSYSGILSGVLETNGGMTLYSYGTDNFSLNQNLYYNGGEKYIRNGAASRYYQAGGQHLWFTAPSGTAGTAATVTERMRIDSSGNVSLSGTTFVNSTRTNLYLNSFAGGGGNGIFFRDGFTYNCSITAEDHNGNAADGICISGYDGVSISTGSNSRNERMRIDSSGNVSLASATSLDFNVSDFAQIRFKESGAIMIDSDNNQVSRNFQIKDGGGSTLLFVGDDGNVGIGTTSPALGLHVGDGKGALFGDTTTGGSVYVSPSNENTINGAYGLALDTGDLWLNYRGYQDGFTYFRDTRIGNGKGTAIVMVDGSAGNVGIGTTGPNELLTLSKTGSGGIGVKTITSGDPYVRLYDNTTIKGDIWWSRSGNYMGINSLSNINTVLNPNVGNVGIGTTSPASKLEVNGDARFTNNGSLNAIITQGAAGKGRLYLYDGGVATIGLQTGGDSYFNNGNVGIGTTSPNTKLEVSGDYIRLNLVDTYFTRGFTTGTGTFNIDVTVDNEGGGGNVFKIEAGFAHYYGMSYNCIREFWVTSRGTSVSLSDVYRYDSANGGSWTASKPNTTTLRVTKNAGTYVGGGKYWVKITKTNYSL